MKNILLLGATGSIGDSVLKVISQNKDISKKEIYNYCLKLKNEI